MLTAILQTTRTIYSTRDRRDGQAVVDMSFVGKVLSISRASQFRGEISTKNKEGTGQKELGDGL